MAPPKHRTSKAKTRHRRSHHGVDLPHLVKTENGMSKPHFSERSKKKKVEEVVEQVEAEVVEKPKRKTKKVEDKSE